MSKAKDIYALAIDYDGNINADMDAVILSINNPVSMGTTINSQGQVVPKPIEFTQTSNPYISNALIQPGKKSPYIEPPALLDAPAEDIPISAGSASTHRLSPTEPVIIKTSMRTEFDSENNIIKNTSLIVGVGTTGGFVFSEEKTSNELTLNSNLQGDVTGNLTGNVLAGIVTSSDISADGIVAGVVTSTSLDTGSLIVNGESLSFSVTQVESQNFLTIEVLGVGSTSIPIY